MSAFDSFGKISLELVLSHPLVTKQAFLYFKFSIPDSRQIEVFPKGLAFKFHLEFEFFSLIFLGEIFLKMVFGDIFDFGPKYYLNLVWDGANRAVAYNHPFCNDVEKKGL